MTFAEKLQKLRKQNGLSQEQLAEKLNVSRQAVSKWEMGTIPDMENMVKLGRYFDCSLDYLMNEEMENNTKSQQSLKIENKNLAWKCVAIYVGGRAQRRASERAAASGYSQDPAYP